MQDRQCDKDSKQSAGIKGWLILVLIGLFFTFGNCLLKVINGHSSENMSSTGSSSFVNFIIFDKTAIYVIGILAVVAIIMMFKRSHYFPKLMIVFLIINLLVSIIKTMWINNFIEEYSFGFVHNTFGNIYWNVIFAAIGILYFCFSKRVKHTFVKNKL